MAARGLQRAGAVAVWVFPQQSRISVMARWAMLVVGLVLASLAALAPAHGAPAAAAHRERQRIDAASLADWGISARIVTGKIPTLNIVLSEPEVLAAWPQIRAAGLGGGGDAAWARAHPLAVCRDIAFAATPTLLHALYDQDDALDFAPVYVSLRVGETDARPLFSMNVNRAIVRKLHEARDVVARAVLSTWLRQQLAYRES